MLTAEQESVNEITAQDGAQIPDEILAVIAAAAAVFLGKRMHICGIEEVTNSSEKMNRWSRLGRVLVQTSHNLEAPRPQRPQ